jgi:DNA-directed RNA polymerase subunit delta
VRRLGIRKMAKENIQETSMVDLFYELLKEAGEPRSFYELFEEIAELKGIPDENKKEQMARLYTEMNINGRFKPLGDNMWGLRAWYPVEHVEEPVMSRKKSKKKAVKKKKDPLEDWTEDKAAEDDKLDTSLEEDPYDADLDDDLADLDELDEELEEFDEEDLDIVDDNDLVEKEEGEGAKDRD